MEAAIITMAIRTLVACSICIFLGFEVFALYGQVKFYQNLCEKLVKKIKPNESISKANI